MTLALLPLTAAGHRPHALHGPDQVWDQTNCSVDVWIEVLHALGLDPLAAAAFAVAADFEGDQWTFFKYPAEDLWEAYGLDVHEMNPWRGVLPHVLMQLQLGRLMTVEVDSWFLPDTAGTAYARSHDKSTIVVNSLDVGSRRMGYFHNSGYYELAGNDFDGALRLGAHADPAALAPYAEIIRLDHLHADPDTDLTATATRLLTKHLALRPTDNPVERMAAQIDSDAAWLASAGPETFHGYAFATLRQCGASAGTAAAFCGWLADRSPDQAETLRRSAGHWLELAQVAKTAQLKLARVARGRGSSLASTWEQLAGLWSAAQRELDPLQ